ncbi:MAG: NAD(P)-dependent alcohol dehydrogenase [Gammaproteobacteria bacterium]|jgi:uncharacterized zinc-type alcohol dehydrogenase-like protein|nr:NAD(P)-dependent alcohol dehydrogenase [Candidatus Thioaporhodococcus sediminis]TNF52718.1 MAG: NAD(P)-dependent alcohol dehydrogenase [Gammaproteobacteria bacterium]
MSQIHAWAATTAGGICEPFSYDPGPLGPDEVEIAVEHCGICHSDLSMLDNHWGMSRYPLVPGHEAVGRILKLGDRVAGLSPGQRVGVGWMAASCMHCQSCLGGDQHLCHQGQGTIVGRHGGFADRLRCHWAWALPLPEGLDAGAAGPLMCGGITVFAPLMIHNISPTARVGVVGIGGLGHLALKFLRAWGCEITAFTSSESKRAEAMAFGAHRVVSSQDGRALRAIAGSLDLIIDTVNVPLDWKAIMGTLAPKGHLHVVGAVLEPMAIDAMALIGGQRGISGSPIGSPTALTRMLDFAARHRILPQVEHFPMSRVNEALEHLRAGKARYRVVLDADFTA